MSGGFIRTWKADCFPASSQILVRVGDLAAVVEYIMLLPGTLLTPQGGN